MRCAGFRITVLYLTQNNEKNKKLGGAVRSIDMLPHGQLHDKEKINGCQSSQPRHPFMVSDSLPFLCRKFALCFHIATAIIKKPNKTLIITTPSSKLSHFSVHLSCMCLVLFSFVLHFFVLFNSTTLLLPQIHRFHYYYYYFCFLIQIII